ncbi:MAG: hypothetical protein JW740_03230, partial [Candidatus Zambryskibacteria bacterium]|nr:hypothetical protein [Candidatus Zambryskibacteria bacterium]
TWQKIKKYTRIGFGVVLIILGIGGLFLPILQGILLIILGIFIVSPQKGREIIRKFKIWRSRKNKKDNFI